MFFAWIILSYILGSVPFGYLISRFSNKNILEIGWKKNSGSNVFKNVGKWQGVLTGLLDVSKGYLAVFISQKIGFSTEIQVFSGIAAIVGHNWSVFLNFAGGRGIGTFAGALLAFSPKILLISAMPIVLLAVIWNAAIGTLLSLVVAIFFSFRQFEFLGFFVLLSLFFILIKRLSPLKEIKNSQNKFSLIRNRLVFDNDKALFDLRIKRIFLKEKSNPSKAVRLANFLANPILFISKKGWKAAKYGVNRLVRGPEKVVTEIRTEDFKKMMVSASKKIVFYQEEINRINVFPVADKDTGYNLAATLLGIEGTVSRKSHEKIRELAEDIKTAAMINARGNAGMICTGYFIEVLDRIKHLESIDAFHLSLAMKRGIKASISSIVEPVEGTILDVIKSAGEKAFFLAKIKREKNIIKVLEEAYKASETALKETKEKLQVLKDNNVVDAGALGFLKILEAWIESLKGVEIASKKEESSPILMPSAEEDLEFRYEIVFNFKKDEGADLGEIKKELSGMGGSLEIIEADNMVKVHIHTNQPEQIQQKFEVFPEAQFRVEDMLEQTKKIGKKSLGLMVDEVADLPKSILEKYKIKEIPFSTRFPEGEIIKSKSEIYLKMKEALKRNKPLPVTSAPNFREFFLAYQETLQTFEKILVITISAKLSGAYSSARIARSIFKKPKKLNIYVFDCNTAEVAEGLVALKASELISQGKKTEEVVEYLKEFCPKVSLVACVDDFKYLAAGGRFRLPRIFIKPAFFIQKMGIKFLVGLKNGKINFFRISFGKDIAKILSDEIDRQRKGKRIMVAIGHAEAGKISEKLKANLEKKSGVEVSFVSEVSPVVGTHTGPGAVLAAFYPIDEKN